MTSIRMAHTVRLRWLALAALPGLLLAGCSASGADQSAPDGPTGGVLTAQLVEPSALAPAQNCYESECSKVLNLVNDPVVSVDLDSGDLVYDGLLKSATSQDNRVWRFEIAGGRTFHNGEPVDADSFIRAWNYSADPENETDTTGFLAKIKGYGQGPRLSGLRKIDDRTFEVELKAPFALFPTTLSYGNAFHPLAEECLADLKKCNEAPIGTGPYIIDGVWDHSQDITVRRWADYRGEQTANPDVIELAITTDLVAAFRAFQAGQIDITELDPTVYREARAAYGDQILLSDTGKLTYMGFPTRTAPWDDPRMRQAVSMAFDRNLIIDQVLNGIYRPSTAVTPPVIPGAQTDACTFCRYDPQRARQLFARAGGRPGMTLELWFNAGAGHDGWVEAIGNQLKQNLGVEFKLQTREWAQFLEIMDSGDFTGPFRMGWLPDYPNTENYLRPILGTDGDSNYGDYSNRQLDALLAKGDRAASVAEAVSFYRQAEDLALRELPILPLWVSQAPIVYSPDVDNVSYHIVKEVPLNEVTVTGQE